jgi:hypothetical protein
MKHTSHTSKLLGRWLHAATLFVSTDSPQRSQVATSARPVSLHNKNTATQPYCSGRVSEGVDRCSTGQPVCKKTHRTALHRTALHRTARQGTHLMRISVLSSWRRVVRVRGGLRMGW